MGRQGTPPPAAAAILLRVFTADRSLEGIEPLIDAYRRTAGAIRAIVRRHLPFEAAA